MSDKNSTTAASTKTAASMAELEKIWGSGGLDIEKATKEDRDLYLKFKLWQYGESNYNMQDIDLWEQYREDFHGWTEKYFKDANNHTTRNLRTTLRTYGVWVGRNQGRTLPEALYDVLQEEKPTQWSQEEIEDHINSNGEFKSRKIAYLIKSGGSSINFGPSVPVTPPLALPVARDPARDITNLAKLYTGDQKYSGQDDNFDFHLTIFNNYCSQLGIQDDLTKAKAYSIMLKGLALDHYFTNLRNTDSNVNIPFNELCNTTRNYFETAEYRRSQLNK